MHFEHPIWLLVALATAILLLIFLRRSEGRCRAALEQFAARHLLDQLTASVSLRLRSLKRGLLVGAVFLLFVVLARPQYGFRWEEAKRKGVDILFAVDVSKSMLAQDVSPDRLTRAKLGVSDLAARLDGDRMGLIAFAGSAFLQCPMTLDYDAFLQSLDALDTRVIPKGGTDVASAIREAVAAFQTSAQNHKLLVLVTDGEDLEGQAVVAAQKAKEAGLQIFTVGVGTSTGELIPVTVEGGGTDFVKDDKGQVVKSRLDESTLRQIAEATGGFYVPLGQRAEGLETVYEKGVASIPKRDLSSRMTRIYIERFEWPLALVIFLLIVEMMLSDRKLSFRFQVSGFRFWRGTGRTAAGILLGFALFVPAARASTRSAEKAYRDGKFNDAVKEYQQAVEKSPRKPELNFNLGAAEYRAGQFGEAAGAFQRSLQTDQLPLQQRAYYNLGNSQYRVGQKTEKTNPQQTIPNWQQALQSYQGALKLKPDDADAKFNYEFVKKKLEELQKQQQNQPNQDKKDQDQQQKDQPPPNQQSQNQQGQNQKDQSQPDQKNPNQPPQGGPDQKDQKGQQPQQPANQDQQKQQAKDQAKNQPRKPESSKGDEKDQPKTEAEPQPLPGQMSKEEAKNLLDSLKDDEKKMPLAPLQEGGGRQEEPKRDW